MENYVYNMRSRVEEAQIQGKMKARTAEDIVQILNGVEEWLDENECAHLYELEEKLAGLTMNCDL